MRENRVGRGGAQSELSRRMRAAFGSAAPSQSSVSSWMRGEFTPRVDHIAMLAAVLGVRPAWLAFDDGPMQAGPAVVDEDEAKRQLLEEQERKYGRGAPPAPAKSTRRTG